jgi:N-acetylglutamate synthase-like GNAT family acetyltransferase
MRQESVEQEVSGPMKLTVSFETDPNLKRRIQEHLSALLPEWFAQSVSNLKYAALSEALPGYIARVDGKPKGLLLLKRHSAISAEIFWLGVDPSCHRSGIGRALVSVACEAARSDDVKFLFVCTLHRSTSYERYERTRRFYETMGFKYVLEEQFPNETNPLAFYMKCLLN